MFPQAWSLLERKFGKPHVIVSAQLEKITTYPIVKMHNSESIMQYSLVVSSLVNVLAEYKYHHDLYSRSNLQLVLSKLPPNLKDKWSEYVITNGIAQPNLIQLESWLSLVADAHDYMVSSGMTSKVIDAKKSSKTVTTFTSTKDQKPHPEIRPPPKCLMKCASTHKLFNCEKFKSQSPDERALTVKNERLCFGCLMFGHACRQCRSSKPCGVNDCTKRHHPLLHDAQRVHPEKPGA